MNFMLQNICCSGLSGFVVMRAITSQLPNILLDIFSHPWNMPFIFNILFMDAFVHIYLTTLYHLKLPL